QPVRREDIIWSYSAVRPLYDEGASKAQEATRDYVLKIEGRDGEAPLLNIFGGKITTYRRLAEHALEKIEAALGIHPSKGWTAAAPLPGGNFPVDGVEAQISNLVARYPFLSQKLATRLVGLYGTRAGHIMGAATTLA